MWHRRACRSWTPGWAFPGGAMHGTGWGFEEPYRSGPWWGWGSSQWGRGFGNGRFFEGGEVRLAILSLLSEGPKHGYQLMKELKERSGGGYRASAGTVYPTLQMLEDEGLIEATGLEGKRVFKLTPAGEAELARNAETVRRIWERAGHWEDWSQHAGPEVFAYVTPLSAMAKSILRATKWAGGNAEREAKIREMINRITREFDDLMK